MRHVRTRMVAGAARLLAERGLQAASFTEVLALTGAPRGSIYHHFPGGKAELVDDALGLAGQRVLDALPGREALSEPRAGAPSPAEAIASAFLEYWRKTLTHSGFSLGCAVLAVTVESEPGATLVRAGQVFGSWRARLSELLVAAGVPAAQAAGFAVQLIAATEGAVAISRAQQSVEPFDAVRDQLLEQARRLGRPAESGV